MIDLDTWSDERRPKIGPVFRASAGTESERRLGRLAQSTFLKLWTYPSPSKDQRAHKSGDGKELCDLVAIFDRTIVLFSDKEILLRADQGASDLEWTRWHRRAVEASISQLHGAHRWLTDFPDRVFLDRACREKFPFDLKEAKEYDFHLVAVASGAELASKLCNGEDSGALQVSLGDMAPTEGKWVLRSELTNAGPLHVLDAESLTLIAEVFDTAKDFLDYLKWRGEKMIGLGFYGTEDELIGIFITEKLFAEQISDYDVALIIPEKYSELSKTEKFKEKKRADEISYLWDELIDELSEHIVQGTMMGAPDTIPLFSEGELGLRCMAYTSRFERRMLASALLEKHGLVEKKGAHFGVHSVLNDPANPASPSFAFIFVCNQRGDSGEFSSYSELREYRRRLMQTYCYGIAHRFPAAQPLVGIGLDGPRMGEIKRAGGIDVMYVDNLKFEEDMLERQKKNEDLFGIFSSGTRFSYVQGFEYPATPERQSRQQRRLNERRLRKQRR